MIAVAKRLVGVGVLLTVLSGAGSGCQRSSASQLSRGSLEEAADLTLGRLELAGSRPASPSAPEMLAALRIKRAKLQTLGEKEPTLKPTLADVAKQYGIAEEMLAKAPSEAVVGAKSGAWLLSLLAANEEQKNAILLSGLSAVGEAASTVEQWEVVHRQVIADRLVIASYASNFTDKSATRCKLAVAFRESEGTFGSSVPIDTLWLRNDSGQSLSACIVVVQLVGAGGDSFSQAFYVPDWAVGELRVATFSSGPLRETVHGVQAITVHAWPRGAAEAIEEIKRPPAGWDSSPALVPSKQDGRK